MLRRTYQQHHWFVRFFPLAMDVHRAAVEHERQGPTRQRKAKRTGFGQLKNRNMLERYAFVFNVFICFKHYFLNTGLHKSAAQKAIHFAIRLVNAHARNKNFMMLWQTWPACYVVPWFVQVKNLTISKYAKRG